MFQYRIRTYIDITRAKTDRDSTDEISTGQISNFNTFLQGIGLRSNITWNNDPQLENDIWTWDFFVEQADVFNNGLNPVGLLLEDLHGIPVVGNLTNTRAVYPPVIRTLGKDLNTWVEYIPTNLL